MAGRAEFFASKAKHDQRPLPNNRKAPALDDGAWFAEGVAAIRLLATQLSNVFGRESFGDLLGCAPDEAERRLRVLTKAGMLRMAVERAEGKFVRYTWSMVDPNLPRSTS